MLRCLYRASCGNVRWSAGGLMIFLDRCRGTVIKTGQCFDIKLLSTPRRCEHENIDARLNVGFPVLDHDRVLWRGRHSFTCDHVFSWNRTIAYLDPNLPIRILAAKGKMLAIDTVDHTATNM